MRGPTPILSILALMLLYLLLPEHCLSAFCFLLDLKCEDDYAGCCSRVILGCTAQCDSRTRTVSGLPAGQLRRPGRCEISIDCA